MGDEQPKTAKPPWRGIAWLVSGLILALGASFLAQRFDLGRRFALDFKGKHVIGIAERMGDDYNIRYEHPDGTIFRRLYKGTLSGSPSSDGKFEIAIVFDPGEPSQFQPAGLSYLPGVAALTLFILGMASVFKGRKVMYAHYLAATGKPEVGKAGKRGAGPGRDPAQARRKQLRIALTLALAFALIVLIYGCPQFNIPGLFKN
ncbi:MAG TPA: hypothetical protein PKW60_05645 [Candidatus Hydrogenedentes bacterium]|nr:hypothetical protein [Candidatus Hydrogenedentota bacterium]